MGTRKTGGMTASVEALEMSMQMYCYGIIIDFTNLSYSNAECFIITFLTI